MRTILASINAIITAVFAARKIYIIARGEGEVVDKVKAIKEQLARVLNRLDALAQSTDPTWDDQLVNVLSDALNLIAETIISELS